jgi:hypothetical protein
MSDSQAAAAADMRNFQSAFTGALEHAFFRESWMVPVSKLFATWENSERKARERREKTKSDRTMIVRVEEVADTIANGTYDMPYVLASIHHNMGNLAFFELLETVGAGQELLELHNAFIISQVREEEPTTYERWGKVLAGLPFPIMPLNLKSTRVRDYNRKLLLWAQEQRSPAGAGPATGPNLKPEDFTIFKSTVAGGTGPYLPVETDQEGRAVVNGANIKVVLDEHQRAQQEQQRVQLEQQRIQQDTVAAIQELQARVAEGERRNAQAMQGQQQQQQLPTLMQPLQYPAAQQAVQQQYPAQQQQYVGPQQSFRHTTLI